MKNSLFFFILLLAPGITLHAQINVYFSHSVDTTLADPYPANGSIPLDEKLIHRISQAQHSIDFCFYNIWRWNVSDSLIAAYAQGVDVRVITEHDHIDNLAVQNLINAGITVIDDTYGINTGDGFMHNKFAIFDFRDSLSTSDDWIWTGSYNATDYGTESNANNGIEIRNHEVSRAYTLEFEEMWGSKGNSPDPDSSRFQLLKTDNTQHSLLVDSIPVELYFSPSDHSTPKIINAVSTADSTLYFCIFAFTRQDICDAMKDRWDSGISVKAVFDEGDWLGSYSKSRDMTGDPSSNNPWNPPAPIFPDSVSSPWGPELLHHKYLIVDSDGGSSPVTVTGSQNWSNNGEYYNDENILVIHSASIANQYLQEFVERYREAGGEYTGIADSYYGHQSSDAGIHLLASPNPFTTSVELQIDCESEKRSIGEPEIQIFDVTGRMVREISLLPLSFLLGAETTWDGRDEARKEVPPGVYFAVVNRKSCAKLIKIH
jgi:phosphatidylserine/phosphatidylglycerophosphate/cardiolipin synthase-like enzyme